jgi:DNA polymerase-3 subunit alpha
MVEDFINRRHGRSEVKYLLPELEPILKDTYGVILYQEQVMLASMAVGGFTPGQADSLRKAMGKKIASLMEEFRAKFVDGARAKGIDEKIAAELFELMAQFAAYGFNKSHSAAYALIAYQTAYLKAHYPVEFMTALLTCEAEEGKTAKVMRYMHYCRSKGIEVLPPDVNESRHAFHPVGDKIRFGLTAIKGLGGAALETITEAKKAGAFTSVKDFVSRVDLRKVNKKVLECLTKAGAFDSLDLDRGGIFATIPDLIDDQARAAKQAASGQFSLFGGTEVSPAKRRPRGLPGPGRRSSSGKGSGWLFRHRTPDRGVSERDPGNRSRVDREIDEMEAGEEVYMCLVQARYRRRRAQRHVGVGDRGGCAGIVTLRVLAICTGRSRTF